MAPSRTGVSRSSSVRMSSPSTYTFANWSCPFSSGKRDGQVVEDLADGRAHGGHLALAAGRGAKRGWDSHRGHACALGPAQNST